MSHCLHLWTIAGLALACRISLTGCGAEDGPPSTSHQELHAIPGASGDEPTELIPVCCGHSAEERALADELFNLLNAYRTEHGLAALARDEGLEQAIQGHCHHMAIHPFFQHTAPEAAIASPWTRAEMCGSSAHGENIAAGQNTATDVMESWKNSPGHNANMLNPYYQRVGIGAYAGKVESPYSFYWGQLFGI